MATAREFVIIIRLRKEKEIEVHPYLSRIEKSLKDQESGRSKLIWKNQNGCCYHCGMPKEISDGRDIFFTISKSVVKYPRWHMFISPANKSILPAARKSTKCLAV